MPDGCVEAVPDDCIFEEWCENKSTMSKTLVLAKLLVKETRKMASKTGEWGPNARTGLIKKQREKDTYAHDKGWMRRVYFGYEICLKWSRETHVIDFPSKQTGEWMDCFFCHALASSGGSYLNFGTLGSILHDRG